MFVTNHVLSGVVIGRLLERHPVTAFVAGVGSHLALDMVPHWGCEPLHGRPAALPPIREAGWSAGLVAAVRQRERWVDRRARRQLPRLRVRFSWTWTSRSCISGVEPVPCLGQADPFGGPARVATGHAKRDRLRALVRLRRRGDCSSWSPTPDRHASILYTRKTINSMGFLGFNTIVRQPPFPTPGSRGSSSAAPGPFEVHCGDCLVMTDQTPPISPGRPRTTPTRHEDPPQAVRGATVP